MTPTAGGGQSAGPVGPAPVAAVIDIGSNSVLLLVAAMDPAGGTRAVNEALATTRLGTRLRPGGTLDAAARARTRDAVVAFADRARAAGANRVWAFGTAALRDAADGAAFAREVAAAAGLEVEVLAGEREARLAYEAVAATTPPGPLLVADVGGRTTELTLGDGDSVMAAASLPVGALAVTEAYLHADPPAAAECAAAETAVDVALASTDVPARARAAGARLAVSGGTATALAALDLGLRRYDAARVQGHVLAGERLIALATRLAAMELATRTALPCLDPGRAAILPAGALVLERMVAAAGVLEVRVSDHAVRHAYLRERLAATP